VYHPRTNTTDEQTQSQTDSRNQGTNQSINTILDNINPSNIDYEIDDQTLQEFEDQYKIKINPQIKYEDKQKLLRILCHNKQAFAKDVYDMAAYKDQEFELDLQHDRPSIRKQWRLPKTHETIMAYHIDKMLKADLIEESRCVRFNSPCFLVPKRSNKNYHKVRGQTENEEVDPEKWRVVVDMRLINKIVVPYTIQGPSIRDLIQDITTTQEQYDGLPLILSSFDLMHGYFNLMLTPNSRDITTFTAPSGLKYRYRRVPQGLAVSPALFISVMNRVFSALKQKNRLQFYMDDLILTSRSFEEHCDTLDTFLKLLIDKGLKANTAKTLIAYDKLDFCGLTISSEGVSIPTKSL
jgi:hypothetical protein